MSYPINPYDVADGTVFETRGLLYQALATDEDQCDGCVAQNDTDRTLCHALPTCTDSMRPKQQIYVLVTQVEQLGEG